LSSTGTLLACQLGNFAEAERMSQEALELALQSGDPQAMAGAWYARGAALIEIEPARAHPAIDHALKLFRELDNRWALARTVNLKGELLRLEGHYEAARTHYEEALILFRELGNPWGVNMALNNLAFVAQVYQDFERARTLFMDSLQISVELKDQSSIAMSVDGLAGVMGVQQQPRRAAQLFGAADALRARIGAHIQAGDRQDYERNVACVRAQLDPATFEECWNEGRSLSVEQMVAAALEKPHCD
jgi:tetratricopeptide (TPR) repeat protein